MTFVQLHYLDEIVKNGSINKAAKSLFVSQSTMSNAIQELESELGIIVFFRHNKGMRLTREGQVLYDDILPILRQEDKVISRYSKATGHGPCKLIISSLHFPFACETLVEYLRGIKRGKYDIRYKESNIQYIIDDVDSEDSDLGLIFMSSTTEEFLRGVLAERGLNFVPLAKTTPHIYVREGHPLAGRENLNIAELEAYPYLLFDLEYTSSSYSEEVLLQGFPQPTKVVHLTDRATVYNVLHFTDAYSIGSGVLPVGFSDPDLVAVKIIEPADYMLIGYIHPARKKLSSPAQEFLAMLKANIPNHM